MKPLDHSLQRLLRGAARAPEHAAEPLPFALEAETLAQWRSAAAEEEPVFLLAAFRRATLCAVVIMVLAAGWSWREERNEAEYAVAVANYEITRQLPP